MTAPALPMGRTLERPAFLRAPVEGWTSLLLLLGLLITVAWALDDARWAGYGVAEQSQTDFLQFAVLLAALWSFVLARTTITPLAAHALGAAVAAPYLVVAVAGVISPSPDVAGRLNDLNASLGRFYEDLIIHGIRSSETTAFLFVLGAIVWATGHFAAFTIFRRHRPLNAVFLVGFVMLTNVSITLKPQYSFLVVFAAIALLLVVRLNLLEQRVGWARRGIADRGEVSSLFLRGGAAFVAVAMSGSVFLAATASSAPLANTWRDLDNEALLWGQQLNHVLGGVTGAARGPSGLFGTSQTIRGVWESSSAPVFRWTSSDGRGEYWRGATYDAFDGNTWLQLDAGQGLRIAPGDPLLGPTRENVAEQESREPVDFTVTAQELGNVLLAPDSPVAADITADVYTHGEEGPVARIEMSEWLESGSTYSVSALVRPLDEAEGGLTENQLATAGVDYPAWTERYVEIRENSLGELTYDTADQIVESLPEDRRDPYHVAEEVQRYLYRTGGFVYDTDVRGVCTSERLVDCFLRTKIGYCEYFATAMVMLLRTQEIPARIVMGYLPGRQLDDGSWEVDRSAAHAWVEVYFPTHGWVRFDPTPGNNENGQQTTVLQPGAPVATPDPSDGASGQPSPNFLGEDAINPGERGAQPDPPTASGSAGGPSGTFLPLLLVVLLLGAAAAVAYARSRRSGPPHPELVYRGIGRLAGRFGYGPRPTQTAYEYADALGEIVPRVRMDLELVARARVEAAYAARGPSDELLLGLQQAYRRIRVGLLRLALRARRSRR
ncbi:MAG: DUF4129 domain-containing protein [Chloroflexi bacterium]|nr:DUF4129 domain-containing protein [Chloroflexota bacterium]